MGTEGLESFLGAIFEERRQGESSIVVEREKTNGARSI